MLRPWKLNLAFSPDPRSRAAVYVQIAHALVEEIRSGRLAPGDVLPGTRDLAEELGVNRKTIIAAFDELVAQGWLTSDGTRGTFISSSLPMRPPEVRTGRNGQGRLFDRPDYLLSEAQTNLSAVYPRPGLTTFDDGAPDTRLFPVASLSRQYRAAALAMVKRNALTYGDPRGALVLRQALSRMLNSERGLTTTADHICLTRGSQMAIHLSARLLVRPGDAVVIEELTYPPARDVFRAAGARIVSAPLDAGGLDIDAFERICRDHAVRLVYLTPHHQFPTTCVLRPDRRMRLLALAEQFRFAIVEDDYDHEFHFAHKPLLPMASVAPRKVIYIGSMSKLLTPSLRLGYIVASTDVVARCASEILLLDRQGDPAMETAVAAMIEMGDVHRHARKSLQVYGRRRSFFAGQLREHVLPFADFDVPEGGLAFWLRLRPQVDPNQVEAQAARQSLALLGPGSFSAGESPGPGGLRLGFASLNQTELADGVRRLAAVLRATLSERLPV